MKLEKIIIMPDNRVTGLYDIKTFPMDGGKMVLCHISREIVIEEIDKLLEKCEE